MNITTLTIVILIYLAIMTGLMALGYKKPKPMQIIWWRDAVCIPG